MRIKEFLKKILLIRDEKTLKILDISNIFSYIICLIGIILMYINYKYFISFDLFEAAIIIFRTGLFAKCFSIMSAFVINKFKEENS
ncbi:MAG: hypothetical protein IKM97_04265 [Clostridia bacterium]|nr:hypothetical protein [Clostridia bacterium]